MAVKISKIASDAQITFGATYSRVAALPIDSSELHFSLNSARDYAATNPYAYVGQKIVVIENNTVTHYSIDDEAGTLKPLSSGVVEGVMIYKGVATNTPINNQVDIPTANGNISAVGHTGWVYFYNGKEYASNGSIWEPLGNNIDVGTLLLKEDAANTYLSKTGAASTYLTKTDASTIYATNAYVGNANDGEPVEGATPTLTQRINMLQAKFNNYYTKDQVYAKGEVYTKEEVNVLISPGGSGGVFWEELSSNVQEGTEE
jgi:hypothetical protein